jgi:predicted transcriptional regulator of viral defense system
MDRLPAQIQNRPFTTREAESHGVTLYQLKKLVAMGSVDQISRGIYRASGEDFGPEAQFQVATLRVGLPSAICLLSALEYHHLTDKIAKRTWILVPASKRTTDRSLKVFRARDPKWKIGIQKEDGFFITNIERTLVDCLIQKRLLGTNTGIEALRLALKEKKTTLHKISEMAKCLKGLHRILPYIEALA